MSLIRDDDAPGFVLQVVVCAIAAVVLIASAYYIGEWSLR